jgi:hypothetical protein
MFFSGCPMALSSVFCEPNGWWNMPRGAAQTSACSLSPVQMWYPQCPRPDSSVTAMSTHCPFEPGLAPDAERGHVWEGAPRTRTHPTLSLTLLPL